MTFSDSDMIGCTICLWYDVNTRARWRCKAPTGTYHNLCERHHAMLDVAYTDCHILSPEMVRNLLAGRSPYDKDAAS